MEDKILEEKNGEESKASAASIEELLQEDIAEKDETDAVAGNGKIPNIYRGRALNGIELYQMTARQKTQVILVAGAFGSGKTTMELALYQMFLRGRNKSLQFAGSKTLVDVVERSKGLRVTSGNPELDVERTSEAIEDKYFHMEVLDGGRERHNLIFTDFAGEIFEKNGSAKGDALLEKFAGLPHIIVLVDGEKLSGRLKDQALVGCKCVITKLLQTKIIVDSTNVHLVYSKNDKILESKNPNIEEIIVRNNDKVKKMLGDRQGKFFVHRVAAISQNIDKAVNYDGLEELLESCLCNVVVHKEGCGSSKSIFADRKLAQSSFDKFAWKG